MKKKDNTKEVICLSNISIIMWKIFNYKNTNRMNQIKGYVETVINYVRNKSPNLSNEKWFIESCNILEDINKRIQMRDDFEKNDVEQKYQVFEQELNQLVENIPAAFSTRVNEIKEVIDKEDKLIRNQLHIKEDNLEHNLELYNLSRLCTFLCKNKVSILKNEKPEVLLSLIQPRDVHLKLIDPIKRIYQKFTKETNDLDFTDPMYHIYRMYHDHDEHVKKLKKQYEEETDPKKAAELKRMYDFQSHIALAPAPSPIKFFEDEENDLESIFDMYRRHDQYLKDLKKQIEEETDPKKLAALKMQYKLQSQIALAPAPIRLFEDEENDLDSIITMYRQHDQHLKDLKKQIEEETDPKKLAALKLQYQMQSHILLAPAPIKLFEDEENDIDRIYDIYLRHSEHLKDLKKRIEEETDPKKLAALKMQYEIQSHILLAPAPAKFFEEEEENDYNDIPDIYRRHSEYLKDLKKQIEEETDPKKLAALKMQYEMQSHILLSPAPIRFLTKEEEDDQNDIPDIYRRHSEHLKDLKKQIEEETDPKKLAALKLQYKIQSQIALAPAPVKFFEENEEKFWDVHYQHQQRLKQLSKQIDEETDPKKLERLKLYYQMESRIILPRQELATGFVPRF